jgi:hypothetical protein
LERLLARIGDHLPAETASNLRRRRFTDHQRPWSVGATANPQGDLSVSWLAVTTLLAEVSGDRMPADARQRLTAYRDASGAGPWWPFDGLVIVADRPIPE